MVDLVFVTTVLTTLIAGIFMAWSIGAVAIGGGAFAPAVGAKAIPARRAAYLLGIVGFFGAVLQGASVTGTVGQGLVNGGPLAPLAASVAILFSAMLMAIGAIGRYPIPAAFTITGAMVGAGLALGGVPAWETYGRLAALWVVAPVLIGLSSYGITKLLTRDDLPARYNTAVIVAILFLLLTLLEFSFFAPPEESQSLTGLVAGGLPWLSSVAWIGIPLVFTVGGGFLGHRSVVRHGERRTNQQLLIWLGLFVAFSGAGNQIGLAVGPLLPLMDSLELSTGLVLVTASGGVVVGAWTGAPRLIEAVAKEYATLSHSRSIAALLPAFIVAQIGIQYGIPVSFNEIIISAIIGSGLVEDGVGDVSPRKLYLTLIAWILSLVSAFIVTYGIVRYLANSGFI